MRRTLVRSNTFVRAAKYLLIPKGHKFRLSRQAAQLSFKKHPHLANDLQTTLTLLSEDAFQPKLKTHKLKGSLEGSWACSGGYDLRIIFEFVSFENSEAILLQTIGSHDEVY